MKTPFAPLPALVLALPWTASQAPIEASLDVLPPAVTSMLRLPRAVASFGGAVLDGDLYVLGGHVGRMHEHSRDNLSGAFTRIDLETGAVQELAGGVALQGLPLVACAGNLVRVGGLAALNARGELEDLRTSAECAAYDVARDAWRALPDLPEPRSSHDAVAVGSRVFVAGGWNRQGAAETWHDTLCVLDLAQGDGARWSELEQPFRRRALALASDGERLYAIGGLDEHDETSPRVDVHDLATGTWSRAPDLPSSGFGAGAFGVDGTLWIALADGALLRLNEQRNAWEEAGELVFGRMFPRLLPTPTGLVVAGGARRDGHVPWIEQIELSDGAPVWPIATLAIDNPTRARQRAAILVQDGELWLVGGNTALEAHHFEPENFLADVARVRPASGTAEVLGALPAPRQSMTIVPAAKGDMAWLVGGFGHDGQAARSQAEILALDLETFAVRAAGELPLRLTQFASAARGDELWLFGGLDYDPDRLEPFEHSDDIVVLDLSGDAPKARVIEHGMQATRRAFGGVELDGRYYVVGGMREEFALVEECGAYDFAAGTWSPIAAPSAPRISPELVALEGKLYLVGGTSRGADGELHPDPSVEVYDPASDRWSVLVDEIPLPPAELGAAAWNGKLVLVSLLDENAKVRMAFVSP